LYALLGLQQRKRAEERRCEVCVAAMVTGEGEDTVTTKAQALHAKALANVQAEPCKRRCEGGS